MKTEKLCLDYTQKGCEWVYTYNPTTYYGLRTMDGTIYKILNTNIIGNSDITIIVDINGNKGPDKFGRDKYVFAIPKETKNGISTGQIIPIGSKLHMTYTDKNPNNYWRQNMPCTTNTANKSAVTQAYFCTGRVLEENAMNY